MGFFDLSDRHAKLDAKRDPLVEIDAIVPWEEFRPALDRVWRKPDAEHKSRAGRNPMDAVVKGPNLAMTGQNRQRLRSHTHQQRASHLRQAARLHMNSGKPRKIKVPIHASEQPDHRCGSNLFLHLSSSSLNPFR